MHFALFVLIPYASHSAASKIYILLSVTLLARHLILLR